MVAVGNPFPLLGNWVRLPMWVGRHVFAPAAVIATSAFAACPPPVSRIAKVTVGQAAAGCRRLGRRKGGFGTGCLNARCQVYKGGRAEVPVH
jgi:hypothetical protein